MSDKWNVNEQLAKIKQISLTDFLSRYFSKNKVLHGLCAKKSRQIEQIATFIKNLNTFSYLPKTSAISIPKGHLQEFAETTANLFHDNVEMEDRMSAVEKELREHKELELERALMQKIADYMVELLNEFCNISSISLDFLYDILKTERKEARRKALCDKGKNYTKADVKENLKEKEYHKSLLRFFSQYNIDYFALYELKEERNRVHSNVRDIITKKDTSKISSDRIQNATNEGEPEQIRTLKNVLEKIFNMADSLVNQHNDAGLLPSSK